MKKPRKRRGLKIDGTYDIECASWSRFRLGVTSLPTGSTVHYAPREMLAEMLRVGGTWWGHNSGTYDAMLIVEHMRQLGVSATISLSGSRVSRVTGGGLTLCDSYSIVPMGIEGLAAMAGRECPSLGWECSCGYDCGGYCRIRMRMSRPQWSQLADYCVSDTESAMQGLLALEEFAVERDYDLRGTVGGASWATASRWLDIPDADVSPSFWRRVRSAYYGGRCTVFRPRGHDSGYHWDITSAYPSALSDAELPDGDPDEVGARAALTHLVEQRPGVYSCTMDVPQMFVPPLPWTDRNRMAFPWGRVSGAWTLPDIERAIEVGCTVHAVHWAVTWPRTRQVFRPAISSWMAERQRQRDTPFHAWLRLFSNSLLGKLGEQPTRRFVRLHPPLTEIRACQGRPPCTPRRCAHTCDSYEQLDFWGQMWSVPYYRMAPSGYIQWAAYGNAVTRSTLHKGLMEHDEDIVYCDTDSMWLTGYDIPSGAGDGPGQWASKGEWSDFDARAPKSYAFTDGSGERHIRSAGVRLRPSDWVSGEACQDRGVLTLLDAARGLRESSSGGLFRAKRTKWTMPSRGTDTGWYGDRVLDASSGATHPVTCAELREKTQAENAE